MNNVVLTKHAKSRFVQRLRLSLNRTQQLNPELIMKKYFSEAFEVVQFHQYPFYKNIKSIDQMFRLGTMYFLCKRKVDRLVVITFIKSDDPNWWKKTSF